MLIACALVVIGLGLLPSFVWSAFDDWPPGVLHALVLPTEPYVLVPALALVAAWCLYARRPWDAVFVVVAPALAVAANTWLLKPAFDRWKNDTLVYPSGHTVSLVATLVVVFLLVRGRMVVAVGAVLLACASVGMVGLGYHYVVDIVGGTFFAVFAVIGTYNLGAWLTRTWRPGSTGCRSVPSTGADRPSERRTRRNGG